MVEAVVSVVIVGVLLVAALNAVGASRTGLLRIGERGRAAALAHQLMAEILQCAYEDSVAGSATLGPDASENTGSRSAFDDVDDYNGWCESPPQNRDGSVVANHASWQRCVAVDFASPADLTVNGSSAAGIKRITVTITYQGRIAAAWTSLRCAQGTRQMMVDTQVQIE